MAWARNDLLRVVVRANLENGNWLTMFDVKRLFQIKLSTALWLMLVFALVSISVTNRVRSHLKVEQLETKVEHFQEHLPEYDIARQLKSKTDEMKMAVVNNGKDHPITRRLEIEIKKLKEQKKAAAIQSKMKK